MINIRTIRKLSNGDGLTLKNGKIKRYKSGYQVATNGVAIRRLFGFEYLYIPEIGNSSFWDEYLYIYFNALAL